MKKIYPKLQSFKSNIISTILVMTVIASTISFSGCTVPAEVENSDDTSVNTTGALTDNNDTEQTDIPVITNTPEEIITETPVLTTGTLKVHYIDVGQGDSILIEQEDNTMLIDAGENNKGSVVTKYLNKLQIDQIDYVVGTHPHSDHIGGLDTVINSVTVSNAIIPDKEHTTKTYEDFIDALIDKEVNAIPAKAGDKYTLGSATFEILSPIRDNYKDLNDWSVVIKLTFGEKSFLFTGDAETLVETDMINNGCNLSADVLKVGHHGSTTSTSKAFLSKVSPAYAIISCAEENSYGHPHDETIDLLNSKNITIYGTYKSGTIVATCDGKTISFKTEK